GGPIVAPKQDIVLGIYYLTLENENELGAGQVFGSPDEAILAYEMGLVHLHAPIKCRVEILDADGADGKRNEVVQTTTGRLIFNSILPEALRYRPMFITRPLLVKDTADVVSMCHRACGAERTIQFLDDAKALAYRFATKSGVTIAMTDMDVP